MKTKKYEIKAKRKIAFIGAFCFFIIFIVCDRGFSAENPLRIQNIQITSPDSGSITVRWDQNLITNAQVRYGKFESDLPNSSIIMARDTSYQVELHHLKSATRYTIQIQAMGTKGIVYSHLQTIQTQGYFPIKITGFHVSGIDTDGGILRWTSNKPATGILEIDAENYRKHPIRWKKPSRRHEAILHKFYPSSSIQFTIHAFDAQGKGDTAEGTFQTKELNAARGKKVRGSFRYHPKGNMYDHNSSFLSRITDGSTAFDKGAAYAPLPVKETQWFEIDLGKPTPLKEVKILWWGVSFPRDYKVESSLDGRNWQNFLKHGDAMKGSKMRGSRGDPLRETIHNAEGLVGRYIHVIIPKRSAIDRTIKGVNYFGVFEVKVEPDVNVKLNMDHDRIKFHPEEIKE